MAGELFAIGIIFMVVFMLLVLGLVIFGFVFWIWMLVDCLERKRFEDKLVWVIVMILLPLLGSVLYYFIVKRKDKKRGR